MKARTMVVALALCVVAVAVWAADSPQMGTWQLNEAKSKFAPGATKNSKVVYEMAGDDVKVTVEGTDSNGNATKSEWVGKFDGKPYAVSGEAEPATRSYRQINARTLAFHETVNGKIVLSGRITVSADGMTRTVTTVTTDAKGMKAHSTAVYDKQM
jgi:hypothetical protein